MKKFIIALMLCLTVLTSIGVEFYCPDVTYAASKKKKTSKKQSAGSKNSNSSKTSNSPSFFQIINEYKANPEATKKKWLNKTIYMKATLGGVDMVSGEPCLFLLEPESQEELYAFTTFKNKISPVVISRLASARLSIGQKVTLKGQIHTIKKSEDGAVYVLCINSEFVNAQTWRCSKCGQWFSKIDEGSNVIDTIAYHANCQYGGTHNWKKIK